MNHSEVRDAVFWFDRREPPLSPLTGVISADVVVVGGGMMGLHPNFPSVHFAGGAAGLPWAAALGRYLAERILDGRSDLDGVLSAARRFPIGRRVQAVLGAPPAFALSHGMLKSKAK